jgi:di/tricarboxylate transporter
VPLEAWLTLAVILAVIVGLVMERLPAAMPVLIGVIALLALGVVAPDRAFVGFANPAPITVAALYVLARGVEVTGAIENVAGRLFPRDGPGGRGQERRDLARIVVPTAASSAFLNNTPIVAIVAPRIITWARRTGRTASRYLMPVSFAAIVGGLVTLIGTSTNLVVSGLMVEADLPALGLFEISRVGLPIAIAAVAGLIVLAPLLVPERRSSRDTVAEDAPEFTVEMTVDDGSPLAGRTVTQNELRNLQGVYLIEIERDGHRIAPVSPDQMLREGDRLVFAGNVRRVLDLQQMPGLRSAEEHHFEVAGDGPDRRFFEAVISEGSRLAGATLKEVGFRSRYDAAVVAIHRAGESLDAKLGEVALRPGDVLLVLAQRGFQRRWREHHDFLVAAPIEGAAPPRSEKSWVVQLALVALFTLAGTGLVEIVTAALVVAVALVAFRVLSMEEARESVDLNIIVLIAASFGLGEAISGSGLADVIGAGLTAAFGDLGPTALLASVLVATMFLTALISNNAAAVLMFPIAIAAAAGLGVDGRGFAVAVAVGASCDFLTPIGYQTNTMVYGMAGYRFTDFARLGVPFTLITIVTAVLVIPIGWPF